MDVIAVERECHHVDTHVCAPGEPSGGHAEREAVAMCAMRENSDLQNLE